jgi:adenylate cyclase
MTQVDILLNRKEKNGLRITLVFRIVLLVLTSLSHLFSHHSAGEVVRVTLVASFFLILSIVFLYIIRKGQHLILIGYLGILIDCFLLCFMPYNWYLSVGFYENVPATYLLKTSLPNITVIFVAINALALRPLYPILIAIIFDIIWLFFFYLVLNDPRTILTESFIDNFFTPSILPGYYFTFMLTITGLGLIFGFLARSYRNSIRETVKLEVQNNQLERYFSPNTLNQIKEVETVFQAKKSKVVVLFSDIRGFTSLSETLTPEQVVQFLREYHSRMVQVIYKFGGTIDKFIGDGIMVTFGTPNPSSDDCERAILCAIEMEKELSKFNLTRMDEKKNPIQQGIGIHFGEAISGNIGSENRLEYTVIGDTVNLASRIESQCKELGFNLIFSDEFAQQISSNHSIKKISTVTIRGKKEPISLFTIGS